MRVRVIREFNLGGRIYTPGAFPYLRVDDDLGAQLLERGLAELMDFDAKLDPAPAPKPAPKPKAKRKPRKKKEPKKSLHELNSSPTSL